MHWLDVGSIGGMLQLHMSHGEARNYREKTPVKTSIIVSENFTRHTVAKLKQIVGGCTSLVGA